MEITKEVMANFNEVFLQDIYDDTREYFYRIHGIDIDNYEQY